MIADQVHGKFKLFVGPLGADGGLGGLAAEVEGWVRSAGVAPKSIGVEFLESDAVLVVSLGYRDDEPGYNVTVKAAPIGRLEGTDRGALERLEQAISAASRAHSEIICHEIYVTEDNQLHMVFLRYER